MEVLQSRHSVALARREERRRTRPPIRRDPALLTRLTVLTVHTNLDSFIRDGQRPFDQLPGPLLELLPVYETGAPRLLCRPHYALLMITPLTRAFILDLTDENTEEIWTSHKLDQICSTLAATCKDSLVSLCIYCGDETKHHPRPPQRPALSSHQLESLLLQLTSLENLELHGDTPAVTDCTLEAVASANPGIKRLLVPDATRYTASGLDLLVSKCKALEEMHLSRYNSHINKADLAFVLESLPCLHTLRHFNVGDAMVLVARTRTPEDPKLKCGGKFGLMFTRCTPDDISRVLTTFPNVEKLDMTNIDQEQLTAIANTPNHLKKIHINNHCSRLLDFTPLLTSLPVNLTKLDLDTIDTPCDLPTWHTPVDLGMIGHHARNLEELVLTTIVAPESDYQVQPYYFAKLRKCEIWPAIPDEPFPMPEAMLTQLMRGEHLQQLELTHVVVAERVVHELVAAQDDKVFASLTELKLHRNALSEHFIIQLACLAPRLTSMTINIKDVYGEVEVLDGQMIRGFFDNFLSDVNLQF